MKGSGRLLIFSRPTFLASLMPDRLIRI